jgi:hypothetical protein
MLYAAIDPAQAKALRGRVRRAKTDRLDARWLCLSLAKEMLPESWLPPAEIQALRDQTRLRKALAEDRTGWAQRLHALLTLPSPRQDRRAIPHRVLETAATRRRRSREHRSDAAALGSD